LFFICGPAGSSKRNASAAVSKESPAAAAAACQYHTKLPRHHEYNFFLQIPGKK
jgi:hypothetical protein